MSSIKQSINAITPSGNAVAIHRILDDMRKDFESLKTEFNQLRTDYNAHVHGGITAGAANSAATTATTAAAVTLKTVA